MLIAAYAGCGKSTAAQQLSPDIVDLPSMPYRWLLPCKNLSSCSSAEFEREKGALHRIGDPRFPQNYILELLRAEQSGKTVLLPTIIPVIDALVERYGRIVYVVAPEPGLKEEYRQRYQARGNSGSFQVLFADDWDDRLAELQKSKGIHRYLKSGEYLAPLAAALMEQDRTHPAPVASGALAELERAVQEKARDLALWVWGRDGNYACPVQDIDRPETREILNTIGLAAYDRDLYPCGLFPQRAVHRYERESPAAVTWFEDETPLLAAVRRENAEFMV